MFSDRGFLIQKGPDQFLFSSEFEPVSSGGDIFVPEFFENGEGCFQSTGFSLLSRAELTEKFSCSAAGSPINVQWKQPDFADFKKYFDRAKRLMSEGQLEKVVPVVFEKADCDDSPLGQFVTSLASAPDYLHAYAFWQNGSGVVGYSPEVLFSGSREKIELMALAGTQAREVNSDSSLLDDPKEMHEHQVVIDRIRKQLEPVARVSLSDTRIKELPQLLHLQTDILAQAKTEFQFDELIECLHPTPALGGEPREQACKLLKDWDAGVERGRFGAPFGVRIGNGEWHVLVGIRSLQFEPGVWRVGSGCGLVEASVLDREWDELRRKRESVKSLLRLL